ncbi:MAG: hypothetical protein ACYDCN_14930, partial [Bacteroidia bacterium]
ASIYKSAAFLLFYYAFRQIFIPCFLNIHPNRKTYREFEGRLILLADTNKNAGKQPAFFLSKYSLKFIL